MIPKEIYGMVSIVIGISSLILPITLLGLNSAVLRYSETYTIFEREYFFHKLYLIHTIFSIIISGVFYLVSDWFISFFYQNSTLIQGKGIYIALLVFLMGQFTMLSAFATSKYRLNVTRISELVFQKAGIPIVLLAFIFKIIPLSLVIPILVGLYFFRAVGLWFFRQKHKNYNKSTSIIKIETKSIALYSLFALIAVITHQAVIDIDTLMVGSMISVSEAGIYKYAFYIAMIVDLPRLNLVALLFPLISKYQSDGDVKGVEWIYKRSSNLLFVLGSFLVILIIPNLDDFFLIIPNGLTYLHSKYVIVFIALSKLFNMLMGVNFEIIASSKKYYVILVINFIALIVVILSNKFLIPIYGATGAALATLLVWMIYNTVAFLYLKIEYKLSPFSINTVKILGLVILFTVGLLIIPVLTDSPILNIAIRGTISLGFLLICYKQILSTDFNEIMLKILRRLAIIK
jgi:O-antigen/teichoic acid export membrane protein